jgi:hypothetical protein
LPGCGRAVSYKVVALIIYIGAEHFKVLGLFQRYGEKVLVPLSISSVKDLYLPVVFTIATGIPVIIFTWLIAYEVSGVVT